MALVFCSKSFLCRQQPKVPDFQKPIVFCLIYSVRVLALWIPLLLEHCQSTPTKSFSALVCSFVPPNTTFFTRFCQRLSDRRSQMGVNSDFAASAPDSDGAACTFLPGPLLPGFKELNCFCFVFLTTFSNIKLMETSLSAFLYFMFI